MPCWFYEKEDLENTPSVRDGIDQGTEARYRREGARFIIEAGTAQGLRYDTMATGVVYFHRFYMFHSFKEFPRYIMGAACLFLAGKVEETPKKCKDIIKIAKNILSEQHFAAFGDDPKEEIMTHERILLQTIKFDLQVEHPYSYLLKYAKTFKGDKEKIQKLVQMAWTFVNDSLCTTLCLQWEPHIVGVGFLYLAGRLSKSDLMDWSGKQTKIKWWEQLTEDISLDIMEEICHKLLDLYAAGQKKGPPGTPPKAAAPQKRPKPKTDGEGEQGDPKAKAIKQEQSREKQRPPPPPPPATHASLPPAPHVGHQSSSGAPPPPPRAQPVSQAAGTIHGQHTLAHQPTPALPVALENPPPPNQALLTAAPHKAAPQVSQLASVPQPATHQQPPHQQPPHQGPIPAPHQPPPVAQPQASHPALHVTPRPAVPHHIPHQQAPIPPPQPVLVQHHQPPVIHHPAKQPPLPMSVQSQAPVGHQPPYQQVQGFVPQNPPATTYSAPQYSTPVYSSVVSAPQPVMPQPSQAMPTAPAPHAAPQVTLAHQPLPSQLTSHPLPPVVPSPFNRPPPVSTQPLQYQHPPPPTQSAPPVQHPVMFRPPPPTSAPASIPAMPSSTSSVPQYVPGPPPPSHAPPPVIPAHFQPPPAPQAPTTPTKQYRPQAPPISHAPVQQHRPLPPRPVPQADTGAAFVREPRTASPAAPAPHGMVPNFPPPPPAAPPASQALSSDLQVDESMLKIAKKYAAQQLQNLGVPRNILHQAPGSSGQQQQQQAGLSAQAPGTPGQAAQGGYSSGLATVRITGREMGRRPSHGTNKRR